MAAKIAMCDLHFGMRASYFQLLSIAFAMKENLDVGLPYGQGYQLLFVSTICACF